MKQRYSELDAIRGIAALMVVLYHYTIRYGQLYGYSVEPAFSFGLGSYGVQLFFMVSGFVIFLTLDKTVHAVDFIASRFSRLYPAYWFAVVFTFSIVYMFTLPGREVSVQAAMVNLTMIQEWLGVDSVDGVYWTLSLELSFYLIMYLLFVTKQIKRINIVAIAWLLLIIGSHVLEKNNIANIHWAIKLSLLLDYGNLFIAGLMFYKIMHRSDSVSYGIILLALIAEYYMHGGIAFLIVAVYFFLFFLFSKGLLSVLSVKPLIYLGTISYSLYLVHQNIGYIVIRYLNSNGLINSVSIILVPLAISIVIASLMQAYVEKPSLVFIRSKWKNSNMRTFLTKKSMQTS